MISGAWLLPIVHRWPRINLGTRSQNLTAGSITLEADRVNKSGTTKYEDLGDIDLCDSQRSGTFNARHYRQALNPVTH